MIFSNNFFISKYSYICTSINSYIYVLLETSGSNSKHDEEKLNQFLGKQTSKQIRKPGF